MPSPFDLMHQLKECVAVIIGRAELAATATTPEAKKRHQRILHRKKLEAIDLLSDLEREWEKRKA